jgi:hypothetical protein
VTLEVLECRELLSLTSWTVNSLGDTGTGSGNSGDLRYCITQADKTTGDNTINFSVTGTITLNSALPDLSNTTGLMDIEGPGAASLIVAEISSGFGFNVLTVDAKVQAKLVGLGIDGGDSFNTYGIENFGTLTLNGCGVGGAGTGIDNEGGTISITDSDISGNGLASDPFGGPSTGGPGIFNNGGDVTISDSSIEGNGGVGIVNGDTMSITGSTVDNNRGFENGGGIFNGGNLTVTSSSINNNTIYFEFGDIPSGAGIFSNGTLTVTNSTIEDNTTAAGSPLLVQGGGISCGGTTTITNSTIAGNSARDGAGIAILINPLTANALTVTNSTIADNYADSLGGGLLDFTEATITLNNSLIALNTSGTGTPDGILLAPGTVSQASAYNLIGTGGSGGLVNGTNGNQVGAADPGLDPRGLENNGGPTQTVALVAGSPAIDKGSNALAVDPTTNKPLTTDQRGAGFSRIVNGTVDIGAYEVQAFVAATAVDWGTQSPALQTASDGLRLLPAGRNTDLPWIGINKLQITLSQPATLTAGDVSAMGSSAINYGPVTVSGLGTSYTITLAQPINAADRVTITIANDQIAYFIRRLDVLPGDVNDDGVVNVQDMVAIRNQMLGILGAMPTIFGDINGDGKVDINDYTLVRTLFGTHL